METPFISRNPILVTIAALAVVLFLFSSLFSGSPHRKIIPQEAVATTTPLRNPFEDIILEAKAVYVWDMNTNKALYAKNAEAQLPLASLTKIMTALVALSRSSPESVMTIKKESLKNEGDQGLRVAERWLLKDIIAFTLIASSNDGADALASVGAGFFPAHSTDEAGFSERSFTTLMNTKAHHIGLYQTYFTNDTGLDRSEAMSGAYGSARDVAHLFGYALSAMPDMLEATRYREVQFTSVDAIVHRAFNTNPLVTKIPGLIASKTGFTDLAGGNLAIAFDAGPAKPIVIALLGSSADGRFRDMEKLVWATLASLR